MVRPSCEGPDGVAVNCSESAAPSGTRASLQWRRGLGNKDLICHSSKWVRACPALTSSSVMVDCQHNSTAISCGQDMPVGSRATMECQTGLVWRNKSEDVEIVCMPTGKWDRGLLTCDGGSKQTVTVATDLQTKLPWALSFVLVEGHGFWSLPVKRFSSWHVARKNCKNNGATLIVVDSKAKENAFVKFIKMAIFQEYPDMYSTWSGINDLDIKAPKTFVSPTGLPYNNFSWCPGHPQNGTLCSEYLFVKLCLKRIICSYGLYAICERKDMPQ